MRINGWLALAVAMGGLGLASSAQASDHDRSDAPAGWKGQQAVRHWVYYPRYRHHYYTNGQTDPFGYDYEANGYYPYYNSGYWKSRRDVPLRRAHFTPPKYYPAWGANRKVWHHYEWHAKHHGRHDHSQW
jgi:hypothetical protein